MTTDLRARYLAAHQTYKTHRNGCAACSAGRRCTAGARLYESFARLQDAYLAQLKRRH
ncbi:hypothetical protein [Streptomyces sp. NPDC017941]|uniref:hypothetical protein n=1 Tax=unclassified Streptomyces TaxID=2593676 RepID=UPI00379137D8